MKCGPIGKAEVWVDRQWEDRFIFVVSCETKEEAEAVRASLVLPQCEVCLRPAWPLYPSATGREYAVCERCA